MLNRIKSLLAAVALAIAPLSLAPALLSSSMAPYDSAYAQGVTTGAGETLGSQLRRLARAARGNNPVEKPRLLGGQAWQVLTSATWPTSGAVTAGQTYYSSTANAVYRVIIGGTIVNGTQPAAANNFSGSWFQDNGTSGVAYQYANYYVGQNFSNGGQVFQIASCTSGTCYQATSGSGPSIGSLADGNITWTYVGPQAAPVITVQQTHNSSLTNWYQPGNFVGVVKGAILTDNAGPGIGNVGPFKWAGGYPVVINPANSNGPVQVAAIGPTYYTGGNAGSLYASVGNATSSVPSALNNAITAVSWSGGVATLTLAQSPSVGVGSTFTASGLSPSGYNGTFVAGSGSGGVTINYALATNPGTSTSSPALSSYSWATAAGGTLTVVVSAATPVTGIGQLVYISGLTNGGAGGATLVNGWFPVNGFTDSQHFTLAMPGTPSTIASITGAGAANFGSIGLFAPSALHQHATFVLNGTKAEVALTGPTQFSVRVDGQDVDNYYEYTNYNSQISNPAQWANAGEATFLIDFSNVVQTTPRLSHTITPKWNSGGGLSAVAVGPSDTLSYPAVNSGDDFGVAYIGTSLTSGSFCYNEANCWYNVLSLLVGLPDDTSFGEGGTGVVNVSENVGTLDYQGHAFYDLAQYTQWKGAPPKVILVDCCTNDNPLNTGLTFTVNAVNGSTIVTTVGNSRAPYWLDKLSFTIGGVAYAAAGHTSYNTITLTTPYAGTSDQATLSYALNATALSYALSNQDSTCNIAQTPPDGCGLLPNLRHAAPNALIIGVGSPGANINYIQGTGTVSGSTFTASTATENSTANASGFSPVAGAVNSIDINGTVCAVKSVANSSPYHTLTLATGCAATGTAVAFRAPMNALLNPIVNPTGSFTGTVTDGTTYAEQLGLGAWQAWALVDPAGSRMSGFITAQLKVPPAQPPVMGSGYQANAWGPCSFSTVSTANANAGSLAGDAALDGTGTVHENDCGHRDAAFSYLPGYMAIINALP